MEKSRICTELHFFWPKLSFFEHADLGLLQYPQWIQYPAMLTAKGRSGILDDSVALVAIILYSHVSIPGLEKCSRPRNEDAILQVLSRSQKCDHEPIV